jgi:UDP-3-O-[3-hydroxymyristoyl] N-acetylglucosamine deacetylase
MPLTKQHTIEHSINLSGVGLHSGQPVLMTVHPAPHSTGIVFRRVDLDPVVEIKASALNIQETFMCTVLSAQNAKVGTIEHFMAAMAALGIDNIIVDINAAELPVVDGSSAPFILLLETAGRVEQTAPRRYLKVLNTVRVEDGDRFVELSPYETGLKLEIEIAPSHPVIAKTSRQLNYVLQESTFAKEISRARTYGFAKDLDRLHEKKLALGANLENAVGISDDSILNPGGLRYPDEFVRHKILDSIGDLYCAGPILGSFKAFQPGHALNNAVLRKLLETPKAFAFV